ncbi:8-oxoguanine deaminase [Roseiarcus fermentans]|uniref:8-oxoguanine deaminase n=1 Tax=Roseiarcus fermentans TaxID=1473586 RepID=A0A366ERH4_9HYPH|nr:8-oxoguanine deaminase [Roseiarcus fermentans]RBP04536.1 8-oxoguanine deaminase [Roseiarcus fermentans]
MRTWIKDPLAIFADGAERGVIVEGTTIAGRVGRGQVPERVDAVFDASRHVVLPGLVNAHHHFYQTLTRAHPAAINQKLFPWLVALYPIWSRLKPKHLRLAVRMALTELLLSGCTTAADHHYLYPAGLEDAVDIAVEEALGLGVRMTVSRGSMNLSAKDGGLPPDSVVQDEDTILADSERVLKLFHDPKDGAMIRIALAPCSPFSISKRLMTESARLAERYDCQLHTHLCETDDEEQFCLRMYGLRPVDLLEETGWMSRRVWLAHGIHFTAEEIGRLGRAGVGVCHCAASNMVLASGICRTCELEAAGAPLGLGVDGSASNDSSNMMEAARHALMIGRLRYGADRVTHLDVLRWATEGSARCLGRPDVGRIVEGCEADLALFTLDEPRFSGAHDPLAALVLCGAHRADRVMVAGAWRVVDGAVVGLDLGALIAEHKAAAKDFA